MNKLNKPKSKRVFLILYFLIILTFTFFLWKLEIIQNINLSNIEKYFLSLRDYVDENKIISILAFILLSIIWILFMGLGTAVCIIAAVLFDPLIAIIITILSITFGSTAAFKVSKIFLGEFFPKYLEKIRSKYLIFLSKKSFYSLIIFRLIPGIPLPIKNILPSLLNIKSSTFFWSTLIGDTPNLILNILILENLLELLTLDKLNTKTIFFLIILILLLYIFTKFLKKLKNKIY